MSKPTHSISSPVGWNGDKEAAKKPSTAPPGEVVFHPPTPNPDPAEPAYMPLRVTSGWHAQTIQSFAVQYLTCECDLEPPRLKGGWFKKCVHERGGHWCELSVSYRASGVCSLWPTGTGKEISSSRSNLDPGAGDLDFVRAYRQNRPSDGAAEMLLPGGETLGNCT